MMKDERYNDRKDKLRKEGNQPENCHAEDKAASEQIKNANAAGMGALERSNQNQIKSENLGDQERDEAVY